MAAAICALVGMKASCASGSDAGALVLRSGTFRHYVDSFNSSDSESYPGYITNGAAWNFLRERIPLFECPDQGIEQTYYFRWWVYRKHIKPTPEGFIITEFLPDVPWAGKDGSIVCAAGHHIYEGRWLADPQYLDDYSRFWFRTNGGDPRQYSTWLADALWGRYLVNGNAGLTEELLPDLMKNYEGWETDHLRTNGLFWQSDDRDGMEMSISGDGNRPTLNSYLYGDAVAIAKIAALAGRPEVARQYRLKAADLKRRVQALLWDRRAQFFEVRKNDGQLAGVRELLGYTPWYFKLPDAAQSVAWNQVVDPEGFWAPFGPTTAEQRNPQFRIQYGGHECQWDGPSWPYATSITLTAMANLLDNYSPRTLSCQDYFRLFEEYTKSHRRKLADGQVVPWLDEDLDPYDGTWIARTLLRQRDSGIPERGKDYNHSTYCDLLITGLVGLRPRADAMVEVDPLIPEGVWDYFCLDSLHYHHRVLTILYDKTGSRYGRGTGLHVYVDGKEIATSKQLRRLTGKMDRSI